MMKNYFLMAVSAMMAFSASAAWDGTAQEWINGDGTKESPYLIETEQHLAYFQQQVTEGETFAGKYIRLETDLNMSADAGMKMAPIGFFDEYVNADDPEGSLIDESKYFLGTFDGNFKVIDNLHIEYIAVGFEDVGGTGLFACLDDGSMVKNVILGSKSIVTGGELTGGLVGQLNGGTVQCCANLATVNSGASFGTGGIAAVASEGKIDRCYNGGVINGNSDVGGIVGTAMYGIEITHCYNKGKINAPNGWYVGGIVGSAYDSGTRIVNCYNIGEVIAAEGFISKPQPIVGDAENRVLVQNCYFLDNGIFEEASGVIKKSEEELKSETMITLLNAGEATESWQADSRSLNNGYPVLAWQNDPSAGITLRQWDTLNVGTMGTTIYIDNTLSNAPVRVYNMNGALVYQGTDNQVTLTQRGIYVVVVDGKVAKVRL